MLRLFEVIKAGKYEVYTSELVTRELEKAHEPKRSNMLSLIEEYEIKYLSSNREVEKMGELYIKRSVIPVSHLFDSLHVALASVYELDRIISYNFHHINRNKTRIMTASINKEEGYNGIMIVTAEEVLNND